MFMVNSQEEYEADSKEEATSNDRNVASKSLPYQSHMTHSFLHHEERSPVAARLINPKRPNDENQMPLEAT